MLIDEKIGVSVLLVLLAVGVIFVNTSGHWKFHEINPIRILAARNDGTFRESTKPAIWGLICVALLYIWAFA